MKNSSKISIQDLIDEIAKDSGTSQKVAESFVKAFQTTLSDALASDGIVKIKSLGTFKIQWNKPRKSVNVQTGEETVIEGHNKLTFTSDSLMKDIIDDSSLIKNALDETSFTPFAHLKSQAEEIQGLLADLNLDKPAAVPLEPIVATPVSLSKDTPKTLSKSNSAPVVEQPVVAVTSIKPVPSTSVQPASSSDEATAKPIENYDLGVRDLPIKKKSMSWSSVLIIVAIVILAGVIGYVEYETSIFSTTAKEAFQYVSNKYTEWQSESAEKKIAKPTTQSAMEVEKPAVKTDTIAAHPQQSAQPVQTLETPSKKPVAKSKKSATPKPAPKNTSVKSAAISKSVFDKKRTYTTFITSVKLEKGDRLTLISQKYYGHKDFWVYIYEANKSKIANPDNVPLGITVKIPKLDKALIDLDNPECLKYARQLHNKYLKK